MLSDEVIEKVSERIINRIEKVNTDILKTIGNNLDEVGKLTTTEAHKLIQVLKYGGDYNKIINELSKVSKLNTKDIKDIFEEVAKNDYRFAEQFYNYRNIAYIPYEENIALKSEVQAIANITARRIEQMMKPRVLGFGMIDKKGNKTFKGLQKAYYDLLDEAVISVSQGKETFDRAMTRQIKEMGGGGLKVIYDSTYIDKDGIERNHTRRLDSAIRMNLKDSLRELHNETQAIFGEQFKSNGVEISVHLNPAPDHQEVQGKQFSTKQFEKLQETGIARTYDKKLIDMHRELKSGDKSIDYRPISQYNCYHYTFNIILGVSEPEYTNEQLKDIKDKSNEKIEIDGKKYTRYEMTQMQRKLETEVRKQKDIQIMAKASGQDDLVLQSQQRITELTTKYKDISKEANIPTRMERMKVSGYKRTKIEKNTLKKDKFNVYISKNEQLDRINYRKEYLKERIKYSQTRLKEIPKDSTRLWDTSMKKHHENELEKYNKELKEINNKTIVDKTITLNSKENCIELLKEVNVDLQEKNIDKIDLDVLKENTLHYYDTIKKYPFYEKTLQENDFKLSFDNLPGGTIGQAERSGRKIELNISDFSNKNDIIYWGEYQTKANYNMPCSKDNYINYFATHELGHNFNYRIIDNIEIEKTKDLMAKEFTQKTNEYFMENIYKIAERNTGKSRQELAKFLSDYGKSNVNECMAELFANANCGNPNALGKAFDEYFKELLK